MSLIGSVSCSSLFEHLSWVCGDQDWQMMFWWSCSDFFSPASSVISGWCQCQGPGTDGISSPASHKPVTRMTPSQSCHPSVTAWSQRRWLSWLGLTLSHRSALQPTNDHFTSAVADNTILHYMDSPSQNCWGHFGFEFFTRALLHA